MTPAPRKPHPIVSVPAARRAQLRDCLYKERCGCAMPKCWWKGVPVTPLDCHGCMPVPGATRP